MKTIAVAAVLAVAVTGCISTTDTNVDVAATPSASEPAAGEPGSAVVEPDSDADGTTGLKGTSDPEDGTIAPYAPGVDQWPDGTRVDFKAGAERQFSQRHVDKAMANWYPNQAIICETVTYDGPLTLIQEIVEFYEGTGQVFGDDAYSIGFATSILAVNQCPDAYAFVADIPRTDEQAGASEQARAQAEREAVERREQNESAEPERVEIAIPEFPGWVELGDSGRAVLTWQEMLIRAGVISDIPENRDGIFGPGMEQAVRDYQRTWGLTADGIAGPETWLYLSEVVTHQNLGM